MNDDILRRANQLTDEIKYVEDALAWWEEKEQVTMESSGKRKKKVEYCTRLKHNKDSLDSVHFFEGSFHQPAATYADGRRPFSRLSDEEFDRIRSLVIAMLNSKLQFLKAEYALL